MGVFRGFAFALFGASIALGVSGCDKKTRACNQVTDEVNKVEAKVRGEAPSDAKTRAAALRGAAEAEEGAARALSALRPVQPELGALAAKLAAAFVDNAKSSRELAEIADRAPDAAAQKALIDRMSAAREAVDTAEQTLASRCTDGTDEAAPCTSFAPILKKHPDPDTLDTDDADKTKAWADAVNAWSSELAKADVGDKGLLAEIDKLQKGYKDLAAVIVDVGNITGDHKKHEVARAAQAESAKAISGATDELNKFCQAP